MMTRVKCDECNGKMMAIIIMPEKITLRCKSCRRIAMVENHKDIVSLRRER